MSVTAPQSYSNWSTTASNIETSWSDLSEALKSAQTADEADLQKTYEWAEDEYDDCGPADAESERQNIEDRFNQIRDLMWQRWDEVKLAWDDPFKRDLQKPKSLADAAEAWTADILEKLGDHETTLDQSTTRMQWTGPGAEAYAKRVPEQTAAMRDLKVHIQNAEAGARSSADTLAALLLATQQAADAARGKIAGPVTVDPTKNFAVRMDRAVHYLEWLKTEVDEFKAGDAEWRENFGDVEQQVSNSVPDAAQLNSDAWPVASTQSLQDMEPGSNSNIPEQPTAPTTPDTTVPQPDTGTPPDIGGENPGEYSGGEDNQGAAENYGDEGDQN